MKVLILGGTGSIGSAIVELLIEQKHEVYALARSNNAIDALERAGAVAIKGDLKEPAHWIHTCDAVDAVIHAAAVWGDEMGSIDKRVVDAVLQRLSLSHSQSAFIYTGGCWLYGNTGDSIATESSAFNPLPSFAWAIPRIEQVLSASHVRGMVIHPAMVYDRNGGVFEHIFEDAKKLGYLRVVGGEHIRWPLVHRTDLAKIYVSMLEQGKPQDVYNAATNHGVEIGKITRTIGYRLGIHSDPLVCDVKTAMNDMGSWAEGYAIDQQMSGEKARRQLDWRPEYEDVFAEIA